MTEEEWVFVDGLKRTRTSRGAPEQEERQRDGRTGAETLQGGCGGLCRCRGGNLLRNPPGALLLNPEEVIRSLSRVSCDV